MSTHLVQHEISGVVVELTEDQLASPLGYLYHPVRVNKDGKHYVTKDGKPVLLDSDTIYDNPQTAIPAVVEDGEPEIPALPAAPAEPTDIEEGKK